MLADAYESPSFTPSQFIFDKRIQHISLIFSQFKLLLLKILDVRAHNTSQAFIFTRFLADAQLKKRRL